MPRSLTSAQIDRLGERLRRGDPPNQVDLETLQRLRLDYDPPMAEVERLLRETLGLQPTSRLKTTGTIIDKLKREKTRLSKMQDIAGLRIVLSKSLPTQDQIADEIQKLIRNSRIVDRRARPSHGYRAVHVTTSVADCPVEIQIRTPLQDQWAQVMEKIADTWGREIRYGGGPANPEARYGRRTIGEFVLAMMRDSEIIAETEDLGAQLLAGSIDGAAFVRRAAELGQQRSLLFGAF